MNKFIRLMFGCLIASFIPFASHASADAGPKFNCTLSDVAPADGKSGPDKVTFATATPEIFLNCSSRNVLKNSAVKSVWIAADTNNAAPADYKIDEKSMTATEDASDKNVFVANFSLAKPENGWPKGHYHVDLYDNDLQVQSIKFDIS